MVLSRNLHSLTHQPAATPNTRLSGTEMPTASRVSFSALIASGSKIAPKKVPKPCFNASLSTINSGNTRNSTNTSQALMISSLRPSTLPRRAALAEADALRVTDDMATSSRLGDLALQQVDQQQQNEGDHQHQHANSRGTGVVVLVEFDHDQQRQNFGFHRHIAGDKDHRTVLTDTTGKGQREARQPGRQQRWQQHMAKHLQWFGTKAGSGFFHFTGNISQYRLDGAHHKRQGDKGQRQGDADRCVGNL